MISSVHHLKRKRLHQASTHGPELSPATCPHLAICPHLALTCPHLAADPQAPLATCSQSIEQILSLATCSYSNSNTQSASGPQDDPLPQDSITVITPSMPVFIHQSYWFVPRPRSCLI